ncbi:DNA invertase Pin-like site-specific DNA recombinase [Actinokineospora baliensis]|uniref:recombinase family protein n=1 Tax=Actinokineospora baliensis TaxID=547056 RepID=UPI0019590BCA|nr:recombinase family protein [Actinokineospora baliensis]MBM7770642.1 DNA invertase Pin-like site-specific DNA recombinase [Actinokineospora baliensis]
MQSTIVDVDLLAGLYLRISDLTDTSTSIPRQEKAGRARADLLNAHVRHVYCDEDKSAYNPRVVRPDWERALRDLRSGFINCLIVYKVDRATRQGIPSAGEIITIVNKYGRRFISIADGIDSIQEGWELQLAIAAYQARKESENTSTRTLDGRVEERDEGRWMAKRPYGFLVTPERHLVLHPVESFRVRVFVRMLKLGVSREEVAFYANRRDWDCPSWASRKQRIAQLEAKQEPLRAAKLAAKPMPSRNSWQGPSIAQVVSTPLMVGHLPHKGESYRHSVTGEVVIVGERLLSDEDYAIMKARFARKYREVDRSPLTAMNLSTITSRPVRSLLMDKLFCAGCGSRMIWDEVKKKMASGDIKMIARYQCDRRRRGGRCVGVTIDGVRADALVTDMVLGRITALEPNDPTVVSIGARWLEQQDPDRGMRRASLRKLIAEEETFLERLEEEKLRGTMFSGARGERRFDNQYGRAQTKLDRYEAELSAIAESERLNVGFIDHLPLLLDAWATWGLAERRSFLDLSVTKIWVHKSPTKGARPTVDRLVPWYVGEPRPEDMPDAQYVPLTWSDDRQGVPTPV